MGRQMPRPAGFHWDRKVAVVLPCGRPPCRWCKSPITAPRRKTFCSDPCVKEWRRRTCPSILRLEVYERDGGRCQGCGQDCRMLDVAWLHDQLWLARDEPRAGRVPSCRVPRHRADGRGLPPEFWLAQLDYAERWKFANNARRHVFEVDHIVPIVEGGPWFDCSNLQILCIPCHRTASRALAARLALARRDLKGASRCAS